MWCNPEGKACSDQQDYDCPALQSAESKVADLEALLIDIAASAACSVMPYPIYKRMEDVVGRDKCLTPRVRCLDGTEGTVIALEAACGEC